MKDYNFSGGEKKYIGDLLNKFGMVECNLLPTQMGQNLKFIDPGGYWCPPAYSA